MKTNAVAGLRPDILEGRQCTPAIEKTIGVLIFPGFEMLDVYGPMDMWGNMNLVPAKLWGGADKVVGFRLVTVAAERGEVAAYGGPNTVADYGYDDAPTLHFLVVPGGWGAVPLVNDQATLEWLRARAKEAELVMSVCNGASLLAAAGILDGREATTNKLLWHEATEPGPRVNWVRKARWVDLGTIVTASGIAAGLDMTHGVISRLYGKEIADWIELWTEYEPHREPSWDPFAEMAGLI